MGLQATLQGIICSQRVKTNEHSENLLNDKARKEKKKEEKKDRKVKKK